MVSLPRKLDSILIANASPPLARLTFHDWVDTMDGNLACNLRGTSSHYKIHSLLTMVSILQRVTCIINYICASHSLKIISPQCAIPPQPVVRALRLDFFGYATAARKVHASHQTSVQVWLSVW